MVRFRRIACGVFLSMIVAFTVLAGSFAIKAGAEEALQIGIDGYKAEDGQLKIYVNQNQGGEFMVTPDYVDVMFGNNTMAISDVGSFGTAAEPVAYKCVVDVSGSMDQKRIDIAKEVIKNLADLKKPEDKVAISIMGNELDQRDFLTDAEEIKAIADSIVITREDTNLYYAIDEEIKALKSSDAANGKKCLIIFSDGADDQATGITQKEAEDAITQSHIPVFTVGLLKNAGSSKDQEMAKLLGSFARISSGGLHFAPALNEGSIDTIADEIINKINSSFIIYTSLEDVAVSGQEVALKVSVSNQYSQTATDTISLPESDVKIIQAEIEKVDSLRAAEEATEEASVEATVEVEEPEEQEMTILGLKLKYFIALAALLAFLLVLLIVLIVKKATETKEPVEEAVEEPIEETGNTGYEGSSTIGGIEPNANMYSNDNVTIPGDMIMQQAASPTMPLTSGNSSDKSLNVTLVRMGKGEEKSYKATIGVTPYIIGRNSSQSSLALSDDGALSGKHCSLVAKANRLYIMDEKSTNGTFVNGVPISGNFELSQDDIILIGSYEYRISWK